MPSRFDLDRFAFAEYRTSTASLALYRIVYASALLLIYLPQHLWISGYPDSFFNPIMTFTVVFTGFPPHSVFLLYNVLFVFAACCLLFGYHTRIASIAVALCIVFGNSWVASFGGVAGDLALLLVPAVLQASAWGDAWSYDASRNAPVHPSRNAWPVALLALLVALAMMGAAGSKAAGGWLRLDSHATVATVLHNYVVVGRVNPFVTWLLDALPIPLWELLDWFTVLLEGAFLVVVVHRRAFTIVCALACFFHLGICLVMEITYWSNLLVYAAFCDWSRLEASPVVKKVLDAIPRFTSTAAAARVALCAAAISFLYLAWDNPVHRLGMLLRSDWNFALGLVLCPVSVVVAARFLLGQIRDAMRGVGSRPG